MHSPVCLLPFALADLFVQVSLTGKVSLADRYGPMAAIFEDNLAEDEQASLDRLLRAVCRGRLEIVDEISTVLSCHDSSSSML